MKADSTHLPRSLLNRSPSLRMGLVGVLALCTMACGGTPSALTRPERRGQATVLDTAQATPVRHTMQAGAVDALLRTAQAEANAGRFAQGLDALAQARALAKSSPPLLAQCAASHATMTQRVRRQASLALRQAHPLRAAFLCDLLIRRGHSAALASWARQTRLQAFAALHQATAKLVQRHPGSAAVQWALARQWGDGRVPRAALVAAWRRFSDRICFAAPQVEVTQSVAGHLPIHLATHVQRLASAELNGWRSTCGRGKNPLRLHVALDDADVFEQTTTSPGAVARPGMTFPTEVAEQVEVPVSITQERQRLETHAHLVTHRDCSGQGFGRKGCRMWQEQVHQQVPVKRLAVMEESRSLLHWRLLPDLPAANITLFSRLTATRRLVVRGHIAVDGANFAALPFAVTALSSDSAHPEVHSRQATLAADPLDVASLQALNSQAAAQAAHIIKLAVREAAQDWAEDRGARANQIEQMQPEEAEEHYLAMLALGLDDGAAVRRFFFKRYGVSADAVLLSLSFALGDAADPQSFVSQEGAAAADLTLLYPKKITASPSRQR